MAQPLTSFRGKLQILSFGAHANWASGQEQDRPDLIDIAKIRSFVPVLGQRSQVDVTGWEDDARVFVSSLRESGEGTLTTIQARDDFGQKKLYEQWRSGVTSGFRLLIPKVPGAALTGDTADDYYVDAFNANVTDWRPNYPPDGGAVPASRPASPTSTTR